MFLFIDGDACVEQESSQIERERERKFVQTEETLGVGTASGNWLQPKLVLKHPRNPHSMLVSHWSRLTAMQFLFFIGHGLHPRNTCFSLTTPYVHAMIVFHWSRFTPTQYLLSIGHSLHLRILFPVIIWLILSTVGCQQHPRGSLQVKEIYYTHSWRKKI